MRLLFLIAIAVVGLVVAGVLHFQKDGNEVRITVDKGRLEQVEDKAIRVGSDLLKKGQESLDDETKQQRR
ncbi:MAG TPA: hypothetical protein VHV77_03360 [Pirellulales bacterium]|jgi:hypothetical protein|nr:hypothetical protein [Pirellulales bacterium]